MKTQILYILILFISQSTFAQQKSSTPYEWQWKRDGIWTGGALAASAGGLLIIANKQPYSEEDLAQIRTEIDDVNFIDKWSAGNYSERANELSDIPFAISFAAPFALLLNDNANDHAGQLFGLYIESLATTSALFTITAGLSNRSRPYTYSEDAPLKQRMSTSATRSFYSGHVAATSTATFFAAKVFQDFNPNSSAVPYVWAGAIALPAAVGYFRIEAGQHFLTDVLLGYSLGALAGYYIPEIHKNNKESNLSFSPVMGQTRFGDTYQGLSLNYTF